MNPFQAVFNLVKHIGTAPAILAAILIPVACVIAAAFVNPQGALNEFLIKIIDLMLALWPSTPAQFKIGIMLSNFAASFPGIGWGPINEIMQGVGGILSLVLFFKLIKVIPFV